MTRNALGGHRQGTSAVQLVTSPDRRLAAEDRRQASHSLSGASRDGSSVACGACGGRVSLSDFVLELTSQMTRTADCPGCGATTTIQLSEAWAGS